ncbi:hypothetical protein [Acidisphaera sp. S103]|uniref:hypothetical protein n=1 Tax=Acidisphaera sp. S103 TaxID=1747223 RepID=UPI00131BFBDE|nr:hypothetical protein [Acidisphaera sp. S103]
MAVTPNTEPALIQPINLTPPPPTPPPSQQSAKATEPAVGPPTGRTDNAEKPETATKPDSQGKPAAAEKDPMRELLDRLERLAPASADPGLARTVQSLSQRGVDPDQRAQPGFRHDVAYALQDMEKSLGRLELPPALRTEMTQLAGTAVGLTNERMRALMGATATIEDRSLVTEIRNTGRDIGKRTDQSHPEIESTIDALENRARLTPRPADPEASAGAPGTRGPNADNRLPNGPPNGLRDVHDGPGGPSGGSKFNGNPNGNAYQNGGNNQSQVTIQHSVLDTLLRAMRPDANQAQPPWEPPATPVADRIATNERRVRMETDDRILASAERRGQAALDALQGFTNGEGAAVMSRIREAAKTEPGGMPQVLSEMRDGGRFADLRRQFGNALSDDAGFAAAYDKAAGALAAYGRTRTEIEPILARRSDATAFTQRLIEMDAEVGKAAVATPSKTEGRSMMEELTKQASELLQRAVDAVKAAFSRSASPGASSSPSPSP